MQCPFCDVCDLHVGSETISVAKDMAIIVKVFDYFAKIAQKDTAYHS